MLKTFHNKGTLYAMIEPEVQVIVMSSRQAVIEILNKLMILAMVYVMCCEKKTRTEVFIFV